MVNGIRHQTFARVTEALPELRWLGGISADEDHVGCISGPLLKIQVR